MSFTTFSTTRCSASQLTNTISQLGSQSLTDAKQRAANQLHEDLLLEGWSKGPNPWDTTFRTTASRSDTLEAAMARVAFKKARFTTIEETTHTPAAPAATARSNSQFANIISQAGSQSLADAKKRAAKKQKQDLLEICARVIASSRN